MAQRPETRAQWLAAADFTLVLSAGFFGFFAHAGLVAELERRGLRPARIAGASAGALVGGLWAAGLTAASLEHELLRLRREAFWDPGWPWGGLLIGAKLKAELRRVLTTTGIENVEDCPTPFTAVVHDVLRHRPHACRRGALDDAIAASCTVPLMFRPLWHDGRLLVDGGVRDPYCTTALEPRDRVLLHFLPSHRRLGRKRVGPDLRRLPEATLVLTTEGLPSVHPFALERGAAAFARAQAYASIWLDADVGAKPSHAAD